MTSKILAEFLGTMILMLLGSGVVAGVLLNKSKAFDAGWIVITMAWGLAVTVAIFAVGSISGAHINPAVTLGLAAQGAFEWAEVPGYIAAQMGGAFIGSSLVWLHYLPHWRETEDPALKRAVFCTDPAIPSTWANLFSEILGTFALVLGILFIGANKFTEGLNPIVVGALVLVIGMALGGTTGYAINPARDLGPRIAHFLLPIHGKGDSNWKYAWIPVLGPVLGGIYGAVFYQAIFQGEPFGLFWIGSGIILIVIVLAVWEERQKDKASK